MTNASPTTWGATVLGDGRARFRLWAPDETALKLRTDAGDLPMNRIEDGWFELVTDAVPVGGSYAFVLDDGFVVPDPAARAQAGDVHGPSRLVDPDAYVWKTEWAGRPWRETVIYEMHVGTFTPEGTFRAAIAKLPHLAAIGITAVEVLPLAQFGGRRGWGYDGVLLYAPHECYGTPDDFRAFVDAAHAEGLMVFLDVVYNHFGPDGNYLGKYAKEFFDAGRHTPWGAAIAFDNPAVRAYFVENPIYWLTEFRLDGLRFDAIDHIKDPSEEHILRMMARKVREVFDRPVHLHTEDERNVVFLHPYEGGKPKLFTAEWNDDYHNVIHPIATGDTEGYYIDFTEHRWEKLGRALTEGFIFQGEPSKGHSNEPRGEDSRDQPLIACVAFNQNHDQVGNRAFGERLIDLSEREMVVVFTAVLLLSPQIPLLWMGEEWGETNPFCFFCDFDGELAAAVRKGRRNEFSKFDAFIDPDSREDIPDPNALSTFEASRVDWAKAGTAEGRAWLALYATLLGVRSREIVPRLTGEAPKVGKVLRAEDGVVDVSWTLADGSVMSMYINMTTEDVGPVPEGEVLAAVAGGELVAQPTSRAGHSVILTLDRA
ncbi:malto-oligosyltrehalose trehalohydrolase [Acuticoccus sediminis]|uniref:malto-oligosyltrehalose trehalohydrolase n=1 Tax=Acuticoccus sediminis TaxID=2184697 RepID=UPI001CFE3A10|nr:malto-oligosyltrehalose trehalohydrolase [Acuticoccus sediminis]